MDLTEILLGALLLSALHAFIPNHWIPLVAIGKSEGWARSEALLITAAAGLAHVSSTILIGILVGIAGYRVSEHPSSIVSMVAPSVLVAMGLVYLVLDLASRGHAHREFPRPDAAGKASMLSLVAALCVAMFFSPCLEIEAYYFAAGFLGWRVIALVSSIYLLVTVAGMVALVDLGLRGASRIRFDFLEHREKRVTGLVLVALGVAAFFVEL